VKIRIAKIVHDSLVDGPGRRTVLFVQGCPIQCPGCQNPHLQDADGGREMDVEDALTLVLEHGLPLTVSGGEPFAQAEAVDLLLTWYRAFGPADADVVVYSGFVYEDLVMMADAVPGIKGVLAQADVLVDGPYIRELDHDRMQWRGSSNQRVIDLRQTITVRRKDGQSLFEFGEPVLLDWDTPALTITHDGDIIAAKGVIEDLLGERGTVARTRMCGQTLGVDR